MRTNTKRFSLALTAPVLAALVLVVSAILLLRPGVEIVAADPGTVCVATTGEDNMTCGTVISPCKMIQYAIDNRVSAGDTISVAAGTYTESVNIDEAELTIVLAGDTIIQPTSPCFTVNADDTTIQGGVCTPSGGSSGIQVNTPRNNLVIKEIEIKNAPGGGDGIRVGDGDAGDDVTNLQILDTYIHDNAGDGVEFDNVDLLGVFEMTGNAFRNNNGVGVKDTDSTPDPTINAEYNEWGHITAPVSGTDFSGGVDADPWVFGKLFVDPGTQNVRENYEVTVTIKANAENWTGVQFTLDYNEAEVSVVSTTDGNFGGSTTITDTGSVIEYRSYQTGATEWDANPGPDTILTVVFKAKTGLSGLPVTSLLDLKDVKLGAKNGVNIYVDSVTNGDIVILATSDIVGRVNLQGRADDTGAVVAWNAGATYEYTPSSDTSDYWGAINFDDVWGPDTYYSVTVEMARYLDAAAPVTITNESQKSVTWNTVKLLGGDANDDDTIRIQDASIIGGQFGNSPPTDPRADINSDNVVDILDLVLMGGNFDLTSSPWTP